MQIIRNNTVRRLALGIAAAAAVVPAFGATAANADTLVTQLTAEQAEAAVLCLTNEKRRRHGVPALTRNTNLATSARRHSDNSVARRWWDATDGNVSHDDPEIPNEPNTTNDIGVRIRAAGYCPNPRSWANSENTFSAARGTPQTDVARAIYPPTPRGARCSKGVAVSGHPLRVPARQRSDR